MRLVIRPRRALAAAVLLLLPLVAGAAVVAYVSGPAVTLAFLIGVVAGVPAATSATSSALRLGSEALLSPVIAAVSSVVVPAPPVAIRIGVAAGSLFVQATSLLLKAPRRPSPVASAVAWRHAEVFALLAGLAVLVLPPSIVLVVAAVSAVLTAGWGLSQGLERQTLFVTPIVVLLGWSRGGTGKTGDARPRTRLRLVPDGIRADGSDQEPGAASSDSGSGAKT